MNARQLGSRRVRLAALTLLLGVCAGCVWFHEERQKAELGVDPLASPLAKSAAYRDTIGAFAYYEGLRSMRVRGFGLVVGLGKNGSRDCPRQVCQGLIENLYKRHRFSSALVGVENITPEQMIDDLDTAIVVVQGEILPATVRGNRFDVAVSAAPGTQTRSLRGGRLYTAELKIYRSVSPKTAITGRVLARASGPVFLNPFSEGDAATRSDPLYGLVLGGGKVVEDRRLRLVLLEASYPRAQQIQGRVNAQFPGREKVADAISPSFIQLHVPPEFAENPAHFLALVRSLYVARDPRFEASRAQMLAKEMLDPAAPHPRIALAFEGLGRAALPVLNDLYAHQQDYVSFHAAVAGLRLGEHVAGDVMIMHAQNTDGRYRFQAIRGLAEARGMGAAAIALRGLLNDEDPRVRIAAYEALIKRGDAAIHSKRIDLDNFRLDRVPTPDRDNLVYVKRSGSRRIALFGDDLRCTSPIFYRSPDGSLTLNANPGDESLTALRVAVSTGAMSPPVSAPLELAPLIELLGNQANVDHKGEVLGLGLDYAAVVRAVHHLCEDKSLNAEFVLEQPNVAELFGPPRTAGRPESEL